MNRRSFLQALGLTAAAGLILDPERLLWVPGKKTLFLPPAGGLGWRPPGEWLSLRQFLVETVQEVEARAATGALLLIDSAGLLTPEVPHRAVAFLEETLEAGVRCEQIQRRHVAVVADVLATEALQQGGINQMGVLPVPTHGMALGEMSIKHTKRGLAIRSSQEYDYLRGTMQTQFDILYG